jgi:ribosomal-protein-alanine N-acetyltransferase
MTTDVASRRRGSELVVESMHLSDVPAVLAIERISFPAPWPARAYRYELVRNDASHYFVLRDRGGETVQDATSGPLPQNEMSSGHAPPEKNASPGLLGRLSKALRHQSSGRIVGYGGFWASGYRAHISTLAVAPQWRGRRFGLLLMLHMLDRGMALGMRTATLEVRVSNVVAQRLYKKCGFRDSGLRRGYYRNNGEDALVMSTPSLTSTAFQDELLVLWEEIRQHLGCGIARER